MNVGKKFFAFCVGAAMLLSSAACSGSAAGSDQPLDESAEVAADRADEATADGKALDPGEADSGDYVFGTDREVLAGAIEQAFSSQGGKAWWEGDTLVVAVDGDADEDLAGFTQCRVLTHFLLEGDDSSIEFPNGRVDCEDVLSEGS